MRTRGKKYGVGAVENGKGGQGAPAGGTPSRKCRLGASLVSYPGNLLIAFVENIYSTGKIPRCLLTHTCDARAASVALITVLSQCFPENETKILTKHV